MGLEELIAIGDVRKITKYLNGRINQTSPSGDKRVLLEILNVIDVYPQNIFFKGLLAKYYIKVREYNAALAIAPDDVVGWGLRAQALIAKGDYDAALAAAPDDVVGLGLKAQALIAKGDYDAALAAVERKLALAPDDVVGLGLKAQALIAKGDYDAALAVAPDNVVGWGLRAQALIAKGDYDAALAVAPDNVVGHYMKAAVYFARDKLQQALQELNTIFQTSQVNAQTKFNAIALMYAFSSDDNPIIRLLESSEESGILQRAKERGGTYREERSLPIASQRTLLNSLWEISSEQYLIPVNRMAVNDVFLPYHES